MGQKAEYEKYFSAMATIGVVILVVNLYYYVHPLLRGFGWTSAFVDSLIFKLRAGGFFDGAWKSKTLAMMLIAGTLVTRLGRGKETPWAVICAYLVGGGVLYYLPIRVPLWYFVTTVTGAVLMSLGWADIGRRMGLMNNARNDRRETFAQCEELIDTPDSINWRTKYFYQGRWHDGWVNCVAPARGSLIMGVPGSGKSFSIFEPMIEQMIRKGYTMFCYDYKFPALTNVVYNDLLRYRDCYKVEPEFCVINFKDPRYSLRCNPLNPMFVRSPLDTSEVADLVMLNINKNAVEKEDFFSMSAKLFLDAIIWFLRIYENGKYCTFAHAIQLMTADYKKTLAIMAKFPELESKISAFTDALNAGAQDQLQGQIASARIPLGRFISPEVYWVLTGDDFTLDINNPEHPKILCVGNDPERQTIYGTTLALITSRLFRTVNVPGKERCGVLIDEFPTVYLKGIDNLIDTARSNKVCVALGCQDKSQVIRDYGEKEAKVIFNTVGNIFSGQVNGETADGLSKMFGKQFRRRESETQGTDSDSVNISFQLEDLVPRSNIESLSQGVFLGKVADTFNHEIGEKFFCGKIVVDGSGKGTSRKPLPRMTDFGEEEKEREIRQNPEQFLIRHLEKQISADKTVVRYDDEVHAMAAACLSAMSAKEKAVMLETVVKEECDALVDAVIQANFKKVQDDIRYILAKEAPDEQDEPDNDSMGQGQDVKGTEETYMVVKAKNDPRIVDPFNGL